MGLIDLNRQERDQKAAELMGMFSQEDALRTVSWFIRDAQVARGFMAMTAVARDSMPRAAYDFGRQHFDEFLRRASELSDPLRTEVLNFVGAGVHDHMRKSRFLVTGDDAATVRELLKRPLPEIPDYPNLINDALRERNTEGQ